MKLAALAKLIKADAYCKLYNVCYEAGGYDLYIGTRTGIYSLAGFPKAQNSDELAALLVLARLAGRIFSSATSARRAKGTWTA